MQFVRRGFSTQKYSQLGPRELIKELESSNDRDLFDFTTQVFVYLDYKSIQDVEILMQFYKRCVQNEFITQHELYKLVSLRFQSKNAHLLWFAYLAQFEQRYIVNLEGMKSIWIQNKFDLKHDYIELILNFGKKIQFNSTLPLFQSLLESYQYQKTPPLQQYYSLRTMEQLYPQIVVNTLFQEQMKSINAEKCAENNNILKQYKFYSVYPLSMKKMLQQVNSQRIPLTSIRFRQLLDLSLKYIKDPQFDSIVKQLQKIQPLSKTDSNKFQFELLSLITGQKSSFFKFANQPSNIDLSDIDFALKVYDQCDEFRQNIRDVIHEYFAKRILQKQLDLTYLDHMKSVRDGLKKHEELHQYLDGISRFLGPYCFMI
ncbi:hypothetical protein pb186bvf_003053 [Paramecium bursaria]